MRRATQHRWPVEGARSQDRNAPQSARARCGRASRARAHAAHHARASGTSPGAPPRWRRARRKTAPRRAPRATAPARHHSKVLAATPRRSPLTCSRRPRCLSAGRRCRGAGRGDNGAAGRARARCERERTATQPSVGHRRCNPPGSTLIGDARRVLAESRSSPDLARPVGGTWHRLLAGARPCGDATF